MDLVMIQFLFQKKKNLPLEKCLQRQNTRWIIDLMLLKKLKNFFK
jgi:hypothetical protein